MTQCHRFFIRLLYTWIAAVLVLSVPVDGARCEPPPGEADAEKAVEDVPSLAEVLYEAGSLGQQLEELRSRLETVDDLQGMDKRLVLAKNRADRFSERLGALNADDLQNYQQLAALKAEVRDEADDIKGLAESLTSSIHQVESWRSRWYAAKKRWSRWRAALDEDLALKSVADAFARADVDIGEALRLISRTFEPLLEVQQKAGDINARMRGLLDRIDAMMVQQRGGALRGGTPVMFSIGYLHQLIDLAQAPVKMIKPLPLPDAGFFTDKGWVFGLQVVLFAILLTLLRRFRPTLLGHAGRRFLGKRPVSVSLFISIFGLSFFYGPQPTIWRMVLQTLAGVAVSRLASAFVREAWVKRAIYILVLVMIGFQVLLILGVPLPVMRLFILGWTAAGLVYFGWRAGKGTDSRKPALQTWVLRIVTLAFGVIAVADFIGFGGFAVQLMDGAIRSAVMLLMGWAMIRLARVVLELGIESFPFHKVPMLANRANDVLVRAAVVCNVMIVTFVAANLLVAWKLYTVPLEALQDFFTFGFTVGGQKITLGLVLLAGAILYGAFAVSWGLQGVLMENVLKRRQMDAGARISITRLVHYAMVLVGFFIALSALGFELKNITIIGGALGVGIGFGMQTIVNNFVCGLILLFERPIKVGDVIETTGGQQGRVQNLGLRATTIQTFDRAEVVVPNNDLIANPVVNWTLGDRNIRIIIPVGVAYGSDVETVMRILMDVASQNDKVLKNPKPMVLFLNFGDSSLDFQLRVWIADFSDQWIIQSELIREIDRRFREEKVEIPFPQRDLHLRSVDDKAAQRLAAADGASRDDGD